MPGKSLGPITQLLAAAERGDSGAQERLWAVVYRELRGLAQHQMAVESPAATLQPTALVHEAYVRLIGRENVHWSNRRHFFGAAAKIMRQIRIDGARKRNRLKRGAGRRPVSLEEPHAVFDEDPAETLALDEALTRLERQAPRQAEVVMLRYHAGMTIDETAKALGMSPRAVDKDWRLARAWLRRELTAEDGRQL